MAGERLESRRYLIDLPAISGLEFSAADLIFMAVVLEKKDKHQLADLRRKPDLIGLGIQVAEAANESRKHLEEATFKSVPEWPINQDPEVLGFLVRRLLPRFEELYKT